MNIETEILTIVVRALLLSGFATILALLWSLPLGVFLGLKRFRSQTFLKRFFNSMMGMPTVSLGLILWMTFRSSGPIGFLHLLYTPIAISIGQAVLITPIIVSFVANSVESVAPEIRDLARTLGASETQVSLAILRESASGVLLAIIASFNRAIAELGVALMVGGNIRGLTRVMTTFIALETTKGEQESGIVLTIILLAIVFVLNFLIDNLKTRIEGLN